MNGGELVPVNIIRRTETVLSKLPIHNLAKREKWTSTSRGACARYFAATCDEAIGSAIERKLLDRELAELAAE